MKQLQQENPHARLRTVRGIAGETNLNRYTIMRIAEEAGAIVRIGTRNVRIDAERFFDYLMPEGGEKNERCMHHPGSNGQG